MKLSTAIEGYLLNTSSGFLASATVTMHRNALKQFFEHFGDIEVEGITTENLLEYQSKLMNRISAASVKVHWRCHRMFFKWAVTDLGIENPQIEIKPPRYTNKEVLPFSQEEMKRMVVAASKSNRNLAMIFLLGDTGLRVSEMCRLELKDYNSATGEIQVMSFETGLKSKSRTAVLGFGARKALWRYLGERDEEELKNRSAALIATVHDPRPLDRRNVNHILERIGNEAGVDNVHPHRFRHTFAIEFLRNGGDANTLQRLLGLNSLMMVKHYLMLTDSDMVAVHKKASPLDNWRL